jgi:hypothetical protein
MLASMRMSCGIVPFGYALSVVSLLCQVNNQGKCVRDEQLQNRCCNVLSSVFVKMKECLDADIRRH